MTFVAELEKIIRTLYFAMLNKKHPESVNGKTINCPSFEIIVAAIKLVLIDGSRKVSSALEIANAIIFKLLQENFFVYEIPRRHYKSVMSI